MIITQTDIVDFEQRYDEYLDDPDRTAEFYGWLADNPQVLMASGFQEFVGAHELPMYRSLFNDKILSDCHRPLFRDFQGNWLIVSDLGSSPNDPWDAYRITALSSIHSHVQSLVGALNHKYHGNPPGDEMCRIDSMYEECLSDLPSFDDIVSIASKYVDNPLVDPTTFVAPQFWTPASQQTQKLQLQTSATTIITEVQRSNRSLESLHWKEFEEIVAEVLRSLGMEIHVVRENPQGGRDIIARAAYIPNVDPLTIAIEVKHRNTIDRPILQQAMQQNKHFPALMLVTSGTFTAGVIREARKEANRMRVLLKDGIAIRDLISRYPNTP